MGNQSSSRQYNLSVLSNVCDLAYCIDSVRGLASDSASPSDTWIITFKKGTKHEDIPIEKAFVKMWITADTCRTYKLGPVRKHENGNKTHDTQRLVNKIRGLDYEKKVYRDITNPLINRGISPNFVEYLGGGDSCSFTDVFNMLKGKKLIYGNDASRLFSDLEIMSALSQSYSYMSLRKEGKPSVTSGNISNKIKSSITHTNPDNIPLRYSMLITELIPPDTLTLGKYVESILHDNYFNRKFWSCMFQVVSAVTALSYTKTTHGDLHAGNIWVQKWTPSDSLNTRNKITYVYNGYEYSFNTDVIVKIFDYDATYTERMGINCRITDSYKNKKSCSNFSGICNEYIPSADVVKVLGQALSIMEDTGLNFPYIRWQKMIDILVDDDHPDAQGMRDRLDKKYKQGYLNQPYVNDGQSVRQPADKKWHEGLKTPDEIMRLIGSKLAGYGFMSMIPVDDMYPETRFHDDTYYCDKEMFHDDGSLKDDVMVHSSSDSYSDSD